MAEATNAQMQTYASERVRPRAQQFEALVVRCAEDKSAIDDIYARGVGSNRWADDRTDGPPHLLQSGNSANPDDMLNYNTFLYLMDKLVNGTFANVGEANSFAANWVTLKRAIVHNIV